MKKLFILFLLLPVTAFGATYTVTQTGSGADYSAATFNAESGDFSDDTFYFSGTFTSDLIPDVYGIATGKLYFLPTQCGIRISIAESITLVNQGDCFRISKGDQPKKRGRYCTIGSHECIGCTASHGDRAPGNGEASKARCSM